jgi:hypothetical protein
MRLSKVPHEGEGDEEPTRALASALLLAFASERVDLTTDRFDRSLHKPAQRRVERRRSTYRSVEGVAFSFRQPKMTKVSFRDCVGLDGQEIPIINLEGPV